MRDVWFCPFDKLLDKNVPHILIKIFLCLDPDDFGSARLVCKRWKQFIDCVLLADKRIRRQIHLKRVVHLWNNEGLFPKRFECSQDLHWNSMDIEAVSCSGDDIVMGTEDEILLFRNLKLIARATLPDPEKVKTIHSGLKAIVVTSALASGRFILIDKEILQVVRVIARRDMDEEISVHTVDDRVFMVRKADEYLKLEELDATKPANIEWAKVSASAVNIDLDHPVNLRTTSVTFHCNFMLLIHENGTTNLWNIKTGKMACTHRFSDTPFNLVKDSMMTSSFHGVVFFKVIANKLVGGINLRVFDNQTGQALVTRENMSTYGRTFFSVDQDYLIFSYADALHNQHFLLYAFNVGKVDFKEFVLTDRPQPMRSMQILHGRLLILSFYRTASALNIFCIQELLDSAASTSHQSSGPVEKIQRLPQGVIAFQWSHHQSDSQKLMLYKDRGILCQKLDYSCENLVYMLQRPNPKDIVGKKTSKKSSFAASLWSL